MQATEMERAYPRENFHLGFDASHLLQLSTSRILRSNCKQPIILKCKDTPVKLIYE